MVHPGLICIGIVEAIPGQEANQELADLAESSLAKALTDAMLRYAKAAKVPESQSNPLVRSLVEFFLPLFDEGSIV